MTSFVYCPHCGTELTTASIGGRLRSRCPACGWVHYQNPTVGVAVILMEDDKLLLGKRRDGGWCIPCGHVEWDEDVENAAIREFKEETGLDVTLQGVYAVHSNFHNTEQHTVGIWYTGERLDGDLQAAEDLLEVAFFALDELPDLKFPTDEEVVAQLRGNSSPSYNV
ncbi:MAG: NUDIX hydrolase [Chloroflexi bacterium]|nr:NUDIX hydrolase [Chloroflexota bacterium]